MSRACISKVKKGSFTCFQICSFHPCPFSQMVSYQPIVRWYLWISDPILLWHWIQQVRVIYESAGMNGMLWLTSKKRREEKPWSNSRYALLFMFYCLTGRNDTWTGTFKRLMTIYYQWMPFWRGVESAVNFDWLIGTCLWLWGHWMWLWIHSVNLATLV